MPSSILTISGVSPIVETVLTGILTTYFNLRIQVYVEDWTQEMREMPAPVMTCPGC